MAKFQIGDKVTNVNSQEKGIIIDVLAGGRGRQLYRVRYGNEDKDSLETNLIYDTDLTDPFECCKQGIFGSYLEFSRINTTFKIQNTSNNTISSLKASKTLFKAYQFKPLLKFLNSANRRLLIADEVGLGKTIEAGHIMMENLTGSEIEIKEVCDLPYQLIHRTASACSLKKPYTSVVYLGFGLSDKKKNYYMECLSRFSAVIKNKLDFYLITYDIDKYDYQKKLEKKWDSRERDLSRPVIEGLIHDKLMGLSNEVILKIA